MAKKRVLGLDTGSNSLGWAIVDREESGEQTLVDKGTLIFQEGVKIEKATSPARLQIELPTEHCNANTSDADCAR